ncbi:MAG TPA: hypothetical protein VKY74_09725, partial [Chloroflexia bacterium]|nr:hypothetical protein [Chloroflexia bacterium]
GGNGEWIAEGHTGFVAEAPTARSFGAALERAWHRQSAWPQMGIDAHAKAVSQLDPTPGRTLLRVVLAAVGAHEQTLQ